MFLMCGGCGPNTDCKVLLLASSFHENTSGSWLQNLLFCKKHLFQLFDIVKENTLELDISLTSSSLSLSHLQHPWGEVLTVSSQEQYQRRLPCSWGWASSVGGGCGYEGGWCWPGWEKHFNTQKPVPVWINKLGHRRELPYGEVLPTGW